MRVKTFDILRGISILLMLITHGLLYWLDPQDAYILIIYRFISNTFLVNGFIFVSGLGFGFSWNHQLEKGTSKKEIYRSLHPSHFYNFSLFLFIRYRIG